MKNKLLAAMLASNYNYLRYSRHPQPPFRKYKSQFPMTFDENY